MSKYTVKVEQDPDTGDLILPVPDELLAEMGWDLGDELVWEDTLMCEDHGEYPGYTLSKNITMSEYYPDNWVVLKIKEGKYDRGFYKVLAGWSGGYLHSDRWRMNSGITRVVEENKSWEFYGSSGSCYVCRKGAYRLTMANAGVYNQLKENEAFEGQITLMPEDTNWMEIEWYGSSQ